MRKKVTSTSLEGAKRKQIVLEFSKDYWWTVFMIVHTSVAICIVSSSGIFFETSLDCSIIFSITLARLPSEYTV